MLLNQLNFKFLKLILVIFFIPINPTIGKEKLNLIINSENYCLDKNKIELYIDKKLNKTDWEVLNILLKNPEISNKAISDLAFLSIDGIGSSLRRMYVYFDITETNYKKVVLIKKAIEISNSN